MQWKIFLAFFRVGIFGYGGGPASIPLVQKEVVEHYNWMTDEEFGDTLAIANTLPGPIVTKLAGYIGYSRGGILGALNGVAAIVAPTALLMILFFSILSQYRDASWVSGLANGVLPVVTVLMGVLTWGFIKKSGGDLGWTKTIAFIIGAAVVLGVLGVHPAIVIAVLLIAALVQKDPAKREEDTST
ncbi:chromate transporter [Marinococcus luteus]|uniref:Chromate transporter n=1 Tax=Marinococcus luteus TaxID=1122204 RepID=A0A1H2TB11_9BACI|nr:chromate transporter [Marinococcus luteus]SDW41081.1 chromate transporter [Marinococcus luteus]